MGPTEYWRRNETLSTPLDPDAPLQPLSRVLIFEVADNALFVKTQEQIEATLKAMGYSRASFVEVHGLTAWSQYQDERAAAVVGTEDEWRQRLP